MKAETFEHLVQETLEECMRVLFSKSEEYAVEKDRLYNFKVAAAIQGTDPVQALAGMMVKHTVSIYDLCYNKHPQTKKMWKEKITDHINYLLLLRGVVEEDRIFTDDIGPTDEKGLR